MKPPTNGPNYGPHENHCRVKDDGGTSLSIVEHIGKNGGHYGQRARSEETGEEPAEHKRLKIICSSATEPEHRNQTWQP